MSGELRSTDDVPALHALSADIIVKCISKYSNVNSWIFMWSFHLF